QTAAGLLGPIQGETGVHVIDADTLGAARAACDRHGAALIFDEIQSGMGRTGTLWAYEQSGVRPDALTAAKALGGGLPVGALVTGERLADVFAPGDHGSTFAGGPVIAEAALAALELTDDEVLLAAVRERGLQLVAALERLPHVRAVRGRGLMLACELDVGAPEVVRTAPARGDRARGRGLGARRRAVPRLRAGRLRARGLRRSDIRVSRGRVRAARLPRARPGPRARARDRRTRAALAGALGAQHRRRAAVVRE